MTGKSTLHNLSDVNDVFKFCQRELQQDIDRNIDTKKRPKHYLLFVDLAKAFDSVDRGKLIDLLYQKGVNPTLVNAIRQLYSKTLL